MIRPTIFVASVLFLVGLSPSASAEPSTHEYLYPYCLSGEYQGPQPYAELTDHATRVSPEGTTIRDLSVVFKECYDKDSEQVIGRFPIVRAKIYKWSNLDWEKIRFTWTSKDWTSFEASIELDPSTPPGVYPFDLVVETRDSGASRGFVQYAWRLQVTVAPLR